MNKDDKKTLIKLAKIAGYTDLKEEEFESVDVESRSISVYKGIRGTIDGKREFIPNYIQSLDAVAKIEKTFRYDEELNEKYTKNLNRVVIETLGYQGANQVIFASSTQRIKAILRTFLN